MTEINGQFGGQKVYELLLDSGEIVYVQPLSIYLMKALRDKAEELYPFPDPKEYERELATDKAIVPGQMIPADENPDYKRLHDEARKKHTAYLNDHSLIFSVKPVVDKATLIKKYRDRLKELRAAMTVPEDDWEATLKLCVLSSTDDLERVVGAINGNNVIPTEEEVRDGMRIFRLPLRKQRFVAQTRPARPSRPETNQPDNTQHTDGNIRPSAGLELLDTEPDVGASKQA